MAKSLNKAMIIGNLGNDPDVRYTPEGKCIVNLSIATSEAWKNRHTNQKQEKTEWHRVVIFGKRGEAVQQYLHKGSKVYIEGKLQTKKWQDQNGNYRYTTEIIVGELGGEVQFLDSKDQTGQQNYPQTVPRQPATQPARQQPASQPARQQPAHTQNGYQNAQQGRGPQQSAPQPPAQHDQFDDDIPF